MSPQDPAIPDDQVGFFFNDLRVMARKGDSVSAALVQAGITSVRLTRSGQPRGLFCGMGVCTDCLVTINGRRSQRACMADVTEDLKVSSQSDEPESTLHSTISSARTECRSAVAIESPPESYDLAVVGAGPAGLHAALTAAQSGLTVLLLDERHQLGGQFFKPRSEGSRLTHALDSQHVRGNALRTRALQSGVDIQSGQSVWYARTRDDGEGFELGSFDDNGQRHFISRTLVIATGAYELPAIIPGWTLPGVMTIGAGQTLIRRYGVSPGQRVLVAGHGPLGLQLAYELSLSGCMVVAMLERSRPRPGLELARACYTAPNLVAKAIAYRWQLRRKRIPVFYGHEITSLSGDKSVDTATVTNLRSLEIREYAVDAVCIGDGFTPQTELARLLGCDVSVNSIDGQMRPVRNDNGGTNIAGLWIAGDAGGLEGSDAAEAQGEIAGVQVLGYLASQETGTQQATTVIPANAVRRLNRARRFQSALWSLYRAPQRTAPTGDVLVCRCEEVSAMHIEQAADNGATTLGALKAVTRAGMGRCQGRYCVAMAARVLAARGHPVSPETLMAPQLPSRPVPIAILQREKPEWGGHRQSSPAARPALPRREPLAVNNADIVVIGAGVTGVCASLFAAREGATVVCLDRGRANGEASGGNAGSLHLQLLSWDFGNKAAGDGSAALATLALQQESIELWKHLQTQTRADFELQITGGMMVAESHTQIDFLQRKVAAEQSAGIHSEVIDKSRMRQIIPAIAERMVAASWCPGEGKINPLLAMQALTQAARSAGAVIEEHAPVTAITRDKHGYRVNTPVGVISAPKLIVAAGGWTAQIGLLVDLNLPVRGAPLQMIVTEPAPNLVPCMLAHADRHLTMKQAKSGTVIIGGAWTAETAPSGQSRVLRESLEGNLWVAERTVPQLGNLHIIRSWAAMNIDIDGAPLLGPVPGEPDIVIAATANGFTLGPLMGREAATLALDQQVSAPLQRFGLNRFH